MGYWGTDLAGNSFSEQPGYEEYCWGDQPADVLGDALDGVVRCFNEDVGRNPFLGEVLAGVGFSLPLQVSDDKVTDDGLTMVVVKRDALKELKDAWERGDDNEAIVAAVRDLFGGGDGELPGAADRFQFFTEVTG